ncbi:hypothetical protein ACHAW5_006762 [Stephanodiscus triporus]|uniref:Peptidase M11 gametolysin domain-containing protein n=1 Tax=Stephanodiscus triporus TaxID=2934178 RepID=A0ABD3NTQ4_9STRA
MGCPPKPNNHHVLTCMMLFLIEASSLAVLALVAPFNFVTLAQPASFSPPSSVVHPSLGNRGGSTGGKKQRGAFDGDGATFTEVEGPVKCVVHFIEPYMIDPNAEETSIKVCVVDPEYEGASISGTTYELDESSFPYNFFDDVEYSSTVLTISTASIRKSTVGRNGGGIISRKKGATATKERLDRSKRVVVGGLRGSNGNDDNHEMPFERSRGRRLAQTMGKSFLIVLYAMPLDASNTHRTSVQLANDIFGINDSVSEPQDLVNARSQVLRCSRGQLNYVPACGTAEQMCYPFVNQSVSFVNGVLQVPINYNITGIAWGTVMNWVEAEAQKILQAQTPPINISSFNQIMHVIPDAADWGGMAAAAYVGGQTSVFSSSYAFVMGLQVHEFGHNIGLRHSGYNGNSYADHSDLMGNPSYGDDGPAICFNGAKSWETG